VVGKNLGSNSTAPAAVATGPAVTTASRSGVQYPHHHDDWCSHPKSHGKGWAKGHAKKGC
jgi:hypothetical protein